MRCGFDVDADAARAVLLGRGDDDAAVAAAEVVDHVVAADLAHLEHLAHRLHRRRHIRHVERARRAFLRTGERRERQQQRGRGQCGAPAQTARRQGIGGDDRHGALLWEVGRGDSAGGDARTNSSSTAPMASTPTPIHAALRPPSAGCRRTTGSTTACRRRRRRTAAAAAGTAAPVRPLARGLAPAQHEQRQPGEQEEQPEHRRSELDHRLEAAAGPARRRRPAAAPCRPAPACRGGRAARLVPLAQPRQHRPVAAEGVVGARADDHGRVDRGQRRDRDQHRDQRAAGAAEGARAAGRPPAPRTSPCPACRGRASRPR